MDSILGLEPASWTIVGVWFKPQGRGIVPVYMTATIRADDAEIAVKAFILDVTETSDAQKDDVGICSVFRGDLTPIPDGDWLPEPDDPEVLLDEGEDDGGT